MKALYRFLSLTLSFQLAVGCTGTASFDSPILQVPGVKNGASKMLLINGSIAVLKHAMGMIVPTAAAAEGTLTLYDYTDPEAPKKMIKQIKIIGTDDFSMAVDEEKAAGKFLKLEFESSLAEDKNRTLLLQPSIDAGSVTVNLDQDTTLKHRLIEAQLKLELSDKAIEKSDIKVRFKSLKEETFEEDYEAAGGKESLEKLIAKNKTRLAVSELLARFRSTLDPSERHEILKAIFEIYLETLGPDVTDLRCRRSFIAAIIPSDQDDYSVSFQSKDKHFLKEFGKKYELGPFRERSSAFQEVAEFTKKLNELRRNSGSEFNVKVSLLQSADGSVKKSCFMFGKELSDLDFLESQASEETSKNEHTEMPEEKEAEIVELPKQITPVYPGDVSPENPEANKEAKADAATDSSAAESLVSQGPENSSESVLDKPQEKEAEIVELPKEIAPVYPEYFSVESKMANKKAKADAATDSSTDEALIFLDSKKSSDLFNLVEYMESQIKSSIEGSEFISAKEGVVGFDERFDLFYKISEFYRRDLDKSVFELQCQGPFVNLVIPDEGSSFLILVEPEDSAKDVFGEPFKVSVSGRVEAFDRMFEISRKINEISLKHSQNFSFRLSVSRDENPEDSKSCRIYGLKSEVVSDHIFDEQILLSADVSGAKTEKEFWGIMMPHFDKSIEILRQELLKKGLKEGSEDYQLLYNSEYDAAKKFVSQILEKWKNGDGEVELSLLKAVDFSAYSSREEAQAVLEGALEMSLKKISEIQTTLKATAEATSETTIHEKEQQVKLFYEQRIKELDEYWSKQ